MIRQATSVRVDDASHTTEKSATTTLVFSRPCGRARQVGFVFACLLPCWSTTTPRPPTQGALSRTAPASPLLHTTPHPPTGQARVRDRPEPKLASNSVFTVRARSPSGRSHPNPRHEAEPQPVSHQPTNAAPHAATTRWRPSDMYSVPER